MSAAATARDGVADRYYRDLQVPDAPFVGGLFWWYGKQDFVPKTLPLWQTLQDAMNAREASWR